MPKRKLEVDPDDASTTIPPATSQEFTSLISKYSYQAGKPDELETKPSTPPITPPKTPKPKTKAVVRSSPSKPRNPGYAPPSAYAHLPTPDLDCFAEDLILVFIGLNPGPPSPHPRN
jgi:hypothetical protein